LNATRPTRTCCSEPGRRFTAAQPLVDVIRAAGSEIVQYTRVEPEEPVEIEVVGHAVGDLVHLLAELLENATTCSAPETRVRVTARHQGGGVPLAIYDDGIGMTAEDLAEANHRLAARVDLTASLAGTMGLLVVARLATRHGIEVRLRTHPGTGTAALIHLPGALMTVPAWTWRPGCCWSCPRPTGRISSCSPRQRATWAWSPTRRRYWPGGWVRR
jgi:signal transduction histidine kinase